MTSAQVEPVPSPVTVPEPKGTIASFFDTLMGGVIVILMGVGLVTLTLTWRVSDVQLGSGGELKVTQSTWWGLQKDVRHYSSAGAAGWSIVRENGDRVPLSGQSISLRN